MKDYKLLYDFASSLGALEGYVFPGRGYDPVILDDWIKNLARQYEELPEQIRQAVAPELSRTAGRTVHSLIPVLGEGHPNLALLNQMITSRPPTAYDDFSKEKEEKGSQ